MNSYSLKARQDHSRHYRCPPVTPNDWGAIHTANREETDICLRSSAMEKAQQGKYIYAIALLSQLINRHPHDAIDYNNRGLVYFQSGQLNQALIDYNRAIQLNAQLYNAYNNRGNYYAACGQLLAALTDYDQAIDLNPSYVRAWINRGITLRELERYDQAVENFDIVESLSEGFVRSELSKTRRLSQLEGHIYAERGRTYHLWGDWNCAIIDYRRALTQLPQKGAWSFDPASRLRVQVKSWFNQLLSPHQKRQGSKGAGEQGGEPHA